MAYIDKGFIDGLRSPRMHLSCIRSACTHATTTNQLNLKEFGQALRNLRKDIDITQREMAKSLGVSPSYLCDAENGHRKLKLSHQVEYVRLCTEAMGE